MVIITYEMKQTVYNYPVQLVLERSPVFSGIFLHAVYTYEKITRQDITLTVIESYYIGKVIMLQILPVHIKYIIVGTEYYRYIP